MKRIVILIVLVTIAGVAGVVVRSSKCSVGEIRSLVSHNNAGDVREEIRQNYELSPGARVELAGLNGAVKIETSDSKTAEVFIERTASTQESLDRRARSLSKRMRTACASVEKKVTAAFSLVSLVRRQWKGSR
jgi:hypothetical protein